MSLPSDPKKVDQQDLPYYKEGKGSPSLFSSAARNREVRVLNALKKLKVRPEGAGKFIISDSNAILEIKVPDTKAGNSYGLNYRGLYSSASDYAVDDCVYTEPDADTRHFWICEIGNISSSPQVPTWPEPDPVYWRRVETGGGGGLTQYLFKSMNVNWIVCRTWNGSEEGPDVNIAKPFKLRATISGTVFGDPITYHDYDWPNQSRVASDALGDETQVIVPEYLVDDIIYVSTVNHTGVTVGGVELTLIDVNADGRAWAEQKLFSGA